MHEQPRRLPKAGQMRSYTAGVVRTLTEQHRLPLDYSVASLHIVDFVVDGLRRDQPEKTQVAETLFGLGAYVGEVIVRRTHAEWVDLRDDEGRLFRQPVGIRMSTGRVWNPLGRVVNRFLVGPEESIHGFFLLVQAPERRSHDTP
ncbi:hypothetical protein [Streptomyces meridianus]|uniref:Uncharacterized protein n=1 Tax=Streptomyces meridianus TaxID=2938945 RepID=A0ABT0X7K0_9ACTN|nr:hypothetical protein [Streptomyces meridianus]MCM2577923.1 hypothetical protein [Streptomyces meridianus]